VTTVVLVATLALLATLVAADWRAWRRRTSFEQVLERRHPDLAESFLPHRGRVADVARHALDVATPAAPRQLGDQELR
jgi:hypothetical protein